MEPSLLRFAGAFGAVAALAAASLAEGFGDLRFTRRRGREDEAAGLPSASSSPPWGPGYRPAFSF